MCGEGISVQGSAEMPSVYLRLGELVDHVWLVAEAVGALLAGLAEPYDYDDGSDNGYESDEVVAAGTPGVVKTMPDKTKCGEECNESPDSVENSSGVLSAYNSSDSNENVGNDAGE